MIRHSGNLRHKVKFSYIHLAFTAFRCGAVPQRCGMGVRLLACSPWLACSS